MIGDIEVTAIRKSDEKDVHDFLKCCPTALSQHSLEFREVLKNVLGDKDLYLLARENGEVVGILPGFIKMSKIGAVLNSNPFPGGYGGPVVDLKHPKRREIYSALLGAMTVMAREEGCALMTVNSSPFTDDKALYEACFPTDFVLDNFYQYIDLKAELKLSRNIKRHLKKAHQEPLEVFFSDRESDVREWHVVHEGRMDDLGANTLPLEFFLNVLHEMVPKNRAKYIFVRYEGEIISGLLTMTHNQTADDYMSSTATEHLGLHANSLLVEEGVNWARDAGFHYWNFQSCPKRGDGVYHYKEMWGSLEGWHQYLTIAVNDLSELKKKTVDEIKSIFKWYFVIPYSELEGEG